MLGHASSPTRTVYVDGQGHGPFELPTVAHKCTFPGISPPLSRGAQN